MFSKSTLLGTFFCFLVFYLLGWAFYGVWAADFFESHSTVTMDNMLPSYIALGTLFFSFGFANLYRKSNHGGSPSAKSGLFVGLWVGFAIGFGLNILSYGNSQILDLQATLVDAAWCLVFYGLSGAATGWGFQLATPKKHTD